jgi:hypothetical protein
MLPEICPSTFLLLDFIASYTGIYADGKNCGNQ